MKLNLANRSGLAHTHYNTPFAQNENTERKRGKGQKKGTNIRVLGCRMMSRGVGVTRLGELHQFGSVN
jgi:hypothetical protein